VFERYADQAACDAHFATPYVTAFLARTGELLTGEPQIEFGTELAGFHRS
jgi:quinol monooxygenase YgiN